MCKKKEFKRFDKMTRQEQEAIYQRALGITIHKLAVMDGIPNSRPRVTCPHCGLYSEASNNNNIHHHIKKCILGIISLEDFLQEWNNPTMSRVQFAKNLGLNHATLSNQYKRLQELGIIPASINSNNSTYKPGMGAGVDVNRNKNCRYCGLDILLQHLNKHENTCVLSKISLDEFISEMVNPTMTRSEFSKKLPGGKLNYFTAWTSLKAAGKIPSHCTITNGYWSNGKFIRH